MQCNSTRGLTKYELFIVTSCNSVHVHDLCTICAQFVHDFGRAARCGENDATCRTAPRSAGSDVNAALIKTFRRQCVVYCVRSVTYLQVAVSIFVDNRNVVVLGSLSKYLRGF